MKCRKISISKKILLLLFSGLIFLCTVGIGLVSYVKEKETLIEQAKSNGIDIAKCAAAEVNAKELTSINDGMENSTEYVSVLDKLGIYRDNNSIVEYIYTMKMVNDNLVFVVDADTEDPAAINEEYEMLPEIEEALNGVATTDEEVTSDEWGSYFSAYAPIFENDGSVAGIVGVDVSVDWVNEQLSTIGLELAKT